MFVEVNAEGYNLYYILVIQFDFDFDYSRSWLENLKFIIIYQTQFGFSNLHLFVNFLRNRPQLKTNLIIKVLDVIIGI